MAAKKKTTKPEAAAPAPANAPNLYELKGGRTRVTYSTSGIDGQPRLHYKDAKRDVTATGDEIKLYDGPGAGTRAGIVIERVPDLKDVSFVLVVPRVNLGASNEAAISCFGVVVTSKTTIGGPGLVKGQVDSYKLVELAGTAKLVEF